MVHTCAAFACSQRYDKASGVTFHLFPKDADIRAKWILAVRRKDDDDKLWQPSQHSCLCSRHFTEDCFYRGVYEWSRKRLFPYAIPTIFATSAPLQQNALGLHHPDATLPWIGVGRGRPRSKRLQTVLIGSDDGLKPSDSVSTGGPRELKRKLELGETPRENDGMEIKKISAELQLSNGNEEMPEGTVVNIKKERHISEEDELTIEPYLSEISPEVPVYEHAARNGTITDRIVTPPSCRKTNTAIEVNLSSDDREPTFERSGCERTKWLTSNDITSIGNGGPTPKKSLRVKRTPMRAVTDWPSSRASVDGESYLDMNKHEHSAVRSPLSDNDSKVWPQKTSQLVTECDFHSQRTKSVTDRSTNDLCHKLELEAKRCSDLEKDNWELRLQVAERNKTIVSLESTSAQLKERLEILTIVNEQLKTRVEFETEAKNRYKEDYDELLKQIC